jgi:hypothetical protein
MKKLRGEHNMESIGFFKAEEVLPLIGIDQSIAVGEFTLKASSLRMRTFQDKGVDCVMCGCQGAYFSAERQIWRNPDRPRPQSATGYHFNLYGVMPDGRIRLMTHDHIIPRCNYGADTLENSVTMCEKCNCGTKRNKIPSWEFVLKHGCDIVTIPKKKVTNVQIERVFQ